MHDDLTEPAGTDQGPTGDLASARAVVVRRRAGVAAVIGGAASAVAIAYLWRASQSGAVLDWTLFGAMALVGAYYLSSLVDARTPLLVADDLGVRIRLGHEWRGLPWEAIGQVVVHPRAGLLRDGRLVVAPRNLTSALQGLDAKARRHVALNQKMYGAPLAVPIGSTTRISAPGDRGVVGEVSALTRGRAEVVELDPATLEVVGRAGEDLSGQSVADEAPSAVQQPYPTAHDDGAGTGPQPFPRRDAAEGPGSRTWATPDPGPGFVESETRHVDGADATVARPGAAGQLHSILGGIATIVSRVGKGRAHDVDAGSILPASRTASGLDSDPGNTPQTAVPATPAAPSPLRSTRPALRAEATLETSGSTALDPAHSRGGRTGSLPEDRELRRPGSVDLVFERVELDDRVRPISTLGQPVAPLVIDDFVTEPAYDPVIGPELTAARTRLGLSVDDLAERTRIRPHVIESIEVDDFAPCGGDFYARGHLRTLARILGKDPAPLLALFEERYATAPVNARRVFEAELATGMTGSMRSTVGGPNWGLLIGVVLTLVLVWGVVRLFTAEPADMAEIQAPALNGAASLAEPGQQAPVAPAAPAAAPRKPAAAPVAVRLTASQADSLVVVRDGSGKVVFSGELVLGERKGLRVVPPVRVRAADGGAVEVRVAGRDRGPLGEAGKPARRTFR